MLATNCTWSIIDIFERDSFISSTDMTEIKLKNQNGDVRYTYISPDNHNHSNWSAIIDQFRKGYDIELSQVHYKTKGSQTVKHRKSRTPLIDADSPVRVVNKTVNPSRYEDVQRQLKFRQTQYDGLAEMGITRLANGQWDIAEYVDHMDQLSIRKGDKLEDIRDKLRYRALLTFAQDQNKGLHK